MALYVEDDDISTDPSDYSDLEIASSSSSTTSNHQDNTESLHHPKQEPKLTLNNHSNTLQHESIIECQHKLKHESMVEILNIVDTKHNPQCKNITSDSMEHTQSDTESDINIDNKPLQRPSKKRNNTNYNKIKNDTETSSKRAALQQESLDFLLAKAMTLYPSLEWNIRDVWCRYCGARASTGYFKSPWGSQQLCYTHHKMWKQNLLDLSSMDEPRDISSVINKSECSEKEYLIDILMQYDDMEPYRRRSLRHRNIKNMQSDSESDESDDYTSSESQSWISSDTNTKVKPRKKYERSKNPLKCKECGQLFMSPAQFKYHSFNIHSNAKPFVCDIGECRRKYTTKGNLDVHIRHIHVKQEEEEPIKHIERKKFKCSECDRRFNKKWYLKNHIINMHTDNADKPYQCRYCTYGSAVKWSLDCHEAVHRNERQFKCTFCPKAFNVKQELQRHVANNHTRPHKCHLCERGFGSSKNLDYHIINIHTKNGDKPFQCKFCDYGAATQSIIIKHEMHHNAETPFICSKCNKSFRTFKFMQTHIDRMHIDEQSKPLECDICGKRFVSKINLKNHKICHETGFYYECDKCEYSTSFKKRLEKHREIHSGQKPYICNICGKRFRLRSYVYSHKKNVHKRRRKAMK